MTGLSINSTKNSSLEKGSQSGRAGDFNLLGPAVGAEVIDCGKQDHVIASQLGVKALYVGKQGDVSLTMIDDTDVVFENVAAGTLLPIQFSIVYQQGTTASALIALT